MRHIKRQEKNTHIFGARFVRALQAILALSVIFVQSALPVAPVFANEEMQDVSVEEAYVDEIIENEDEEQNEEGESDISESAQSESYGVASGADTVTDSGSNQIEEEITEETETLNGEEENVADEIVEAVLVSDETGLDPTSSVADTTPEELEEIASTTSESSHEVLSDTDEIVVVFDSASTTLNEEDVVDESAIETEAESVVVETVEDLENNPTPIVSTSTEIVASTSESHIEIIDDGHFNFSEQECAQVGDGTFYCSTEKVAPIGTGINRVFAAPDADGDSEIYIESDSVLTQISFNVLDDSAPYYDERSESLVWHRLINERYQIVSYSFETGLEEVLTFDRYNNMQPSRYGDSTVWQGWVGDDWEIMLDYHGELSMLTDNATHDVGPQVNGEYVIWQSFEMGVWKAKIYNIRTKQIETIADTEGSSVENPRFVLVYDSKSESGDVETRGYDLVSGTDVPLSSRPAPVPTEIPDPDQTGEDRALISTATQMKTKSEDESDTNPTTGEPPEIDTDSEPIEGDLVIPEFVAEDTKEIDIFSATTSDMSDTISDLIIPAENIPPVPDLIIPPYETTVDEPILPQQGVATSS